MHVFKHLGVVMKHKALVFVHCVRSGIPIQGLLHDMSKFSPTEFTPGAKYCTGKGSPIPIERRAEGYSKAWIHHKAHNKHHIEYWVDYFEDTKQLVPVEMPKKYVIEMFCDMLAANKVYRGKSHSEGDAIKYFREKQMAERMHKNSAALLEKYFTVLAEKGEREAFRYIRKTRRQKGADAL